MVENTAYKKLEDWWDEQQNKSENKDTLHTDITPIQKKTETINTNTLLENHRDNLDLGGYANSFSLGLRAQIPKMPSFRRIPKRVSPKRRDSEKNLSDQEEIVQNSDDEKDQINNEPIIRRKSSLSSFFTTTDSSSGELSSSDHSSSDSESEMKLKTRNSKPKEMVLDTKSKLKIKDNRIYSTDSDSDDDLSKISDPVTPIPNEEVSMSPTRPKTPGHDIDLEPEPPVQDKKTLIMLGDRVYSDSDEEREYQERRRRNTEYMEQIEREFMEEQKQKQMMEQALKEKAEASKTLSSEAKQDEKPDPARLEEAEYLLSLSESGEREVPRTPGKSYSALEELIKLSTTESK